MEMAEVAAHAEVVREEDHHAAANVIPEVAVAEAQQG
jgi:hypothetical protein